MQAEYPREAPATSVQNLYAFFVSDTNVERVTNTPILFTGSLMIPPENKYALLCYLLREDDGLRHYLPLSSPNRYVCRGITDILRRLDASTLSLDAMTVQKMRNTSLALVISTLIEPPGLVERSQALLCLSTWSTYDLRSPVGHAGMILKDDTESSWVPMTSTGKTETMNLRAFIVMANPEETGHVLTNMLPIKVENTQILTPMLLDLRENLLKVIITNDCGDFIRKLPITGCQILSTCVEDLFTADNAVRFGLPVDLTECIREQKPCLFISSKEELVPTAESWEECKIRRREWSLVDVLPECDFDGWYSEPS